MLQALALARGLPDGLTFANPPLLKYALLVEYTAAFELKTLAGTTHSAQDFIAEFRADPSQLYLIGRATSALMGAATVGAAFALGVSLREPRVGLIGAWLTAVSYLLVRESHFAVNDALVTLLVTSALVFCVRVARGGGRTDYLAAGALAGLAFAAKYHGLVALLSLVLAHVLRAGNRRHVDLVFGVMASIAMVVVAFPSLVTETPRVLNDVYVHLYVGAVSGYDGLDPSGGYAFYARTLVWGLGWPLLIAALTGLVHSIVRRDRALLVLGSVPVCLFAVLGAQQMFFARFLLPALPVLVVQAAVVLDGLIRVRVRLGLAVVLVAALPTLVDAVRFDALLAQPDTRALARDWIASNLPDGATLAVDSAPLGPALSTQRHQVLVASDWSLFEMTTAEYRARGVGYLVVSSFTSEVRSLDPVRDARRRAFYADVQRDAEVLSQFRPYGGQPVAFVYDQIYAPLDSLDKLERPGPTITVFRFNAPPNTPP